MKKRIFQAFVFVAVLMSVVIRGWWSPPKKIIIIKTYLLCAYFVCELFFPNLPPSQKKSFFSRVNKGNGTFSQERKKRKKYTKLIGFTTSLNSQFSHVRWQWEKVARMEATSLHFLFSFSSSFFSVDVEWALFFPHTSFFPQKIKLILPRKIGKGNSTRIIFILFFVVVR